MHNLSRSLVLNMQIVVHDCYTIFRINHCISTCFWYKFTDLLMFSHIFRTHNRNRQFSMLLSTMKFFRAIRYSFMHFKITPWFFYIFFLSVIHFFYPDILLILCTFYGLKQSRNFFFPYCNLMYQWYYYY